MKILLLYPMHDGDLEWADYVFLSVMAAQIVAELENNEQAGWRGQVVFVDDNFLGNKGHVKRGILPAIRAWMQARNDPSVVSTTEAMTYAIYGYHFRKIFGNIL